MRPVRLEHRPGSPASATTPSSTSPTPTTSRSSARPGPASPPSSTRSPSRSTAPRTGGGASNAISYALAPTTQPVHRLADLRRRPRTATRWPARSAASGRQIQQKNVSLVRFADPTAVTIDPDGPPPETAGRGDQRAQRPRSRTCSGLGVRRLLPVRRPPPGRVRPVPDRERRATGRRSCSSCSAPATTRPSGSAPALRPRHAAQRSRRAHRAARPATPTPPGRPKPRPGPGKPSSEQLAGTVEQLVPQVLRGPGPRRRGRGPSRGPLRTEVALLTSIRTPATGWATLQRQVADRVRRRRRRPDEAAETAAPGLHRCR